MTTTDLLSISQLCDHGCSALFKEHTLVVLNINETVILEGVRDPATYMWIVQIQETTTDASCSAIILKYTTKANLAQFMHGALRFPVETTLIKAIDSKFLSTFPGLTTPLVKKYPPKSAETIKGHLDHERKNLQSTKSEEAQPIPPPREKIDLITCIILDVTKKITQI